MNRPRRKSVRAILTLEPLDERIAPAHLGVGAVHAMMAQHHAAIVSHAGNRLQANALHARHAAHHVVSSIQAHAPPATPSTLATNHNVLHSKGLHPTTATAALAASPKVSHPTTPNVMPIQPVTPAPAPVVTTNDMPTSLPANAGNVLNTIYQEYQKYTDDGGTGTFTSSYSQYVRLDGSNVGVSVHGDGSGDFASLVSALQGLGMQVTATDAVTQTVEGMLPIDQLANAAQAPHTLSLSPEFVPILR